MLASPLLFQRLGWAGVAGATPTILAWGGGTFFAVCLAYQAAPHLLPAAAVAPVGAVSLQVLVLGGALLCILSKAMRYPLSFKRGLAR